MAHQEEPMDVDIIESDFDNKENTYQSNVLCRLPCTEKGYEELDVSELNMKLRYSYTPTSSPMSKSYSANTSNSDVKTEVHDDPLTSVNENNLTRSLNSAISINNSLKSLKSLPLQSIPTEQFVDGNRNTAVLRTIDSSEIDSNVMVTVTGANDLDENLSLPSSSSSITPTPEATTPTKDIPKQDGGSPIMRGLKTVLSMFRSSQSPIPPSEDENKPRESSPAASLAEVSESKPQTILASTPVSNKSKDANSSRRSSPLKESLVFNDDLERELQWKDETTIIFSEEKIPIHKLFFQTTKPIDSIIDSPAKPDVSMKQINVDSTIEYMDISYNDSAMVNDGKTLTDTQTEDLIRRIDACIDSDSEFLDCESTFTKHESKIIESREVTANGIEVETDNADESNKSLYDINSKEESMPVEEHKVNAELNTTIPEVPNISQEENIQKSDLAQKHNDNHNLLQINTNKIEIIEINSEDTNNLQETPISIPTNLAQDNKVSYNLTLDNIKNIEVDEMKSTLSEVPNVLQKASISIPTDLAKENKIHCNETPVNIETIEVDEVNTTLSDVPSIIQEAPNFIPTINENIVVDKMNSFLSEVPNIVQETSISIPTDLVQENNSNISNLCQLSKDNVADELANTSMNNMQQANIPIPRDLTQQDSITDLNQPQLEKNNVVDEFTQETSISSINTSINSLQQANISIPTRLTQESCITDSNQPQLERNNVHELNNILPADPNTIQHANFPVPTTMKQDNDVVFNSSPTEIDSVVISQVNNTVHKEQKTDFIYTVLPQEYTSELNTIKNKDEALTYNLSIDEKLTNNTEITAKNIEFVKKINAEVLDASVSNKSCEEIINNCQNTLPNEVQSILIANSNITVDTFTKIHNQKDIDNNSNILPDTDVTATTEIAINDKDKKQEIVEYRKSNNLETNAFGNSVKTLKVIDNIIQNTTSIVLALDAALASPSTEINTQSQLNLTIENNVENSVLDTKLDGCTFNNVDSSNKECKSSDNNAPNEVPLPDADSDNELLHSKNFNVSKLETIDLKSNSMLDVLSNITNISSENDVSKNPTSQIEAPLFERGDEETTLATSTSSELNKNTLALTTTESSLDNPITLDHLELATAVNDISKSIPLTEIIRDNSEGLTEQIKINSEITLKEHETNNYQEHLKNIIIKESLGQNSAKIESTTRTEMLENNLTQSIANNQPENKIESSQENANLSYIMKTKSAEQITSIKEIIEVNDHSMKKMEVDDITTNINKFCEPIDDLSLKIVPTDTKNIQLNGIKLNLEEELVLSGSTSPYVSLSTELTEAVEIPQQSTDSYNLEQITVEHNPSVIDVEATLRSQSPVIVSKGYNINFDEIENPFTTKTKIRQSPPLDTPAGKTTVTKNRRKSQPADKKGNNKRKSFNKVLNSKPTDSVTFKPLNESFVKVDKIENNDVEQKRLIKEISCGIQDITLSIKQENNIDVDIAKVVSNDIIQDKTIEEIKDKVQIQHQAGPHTNVTNEEAGDGGNDFVDMVSSMTTNVTKDATSSSEQSTYYSLGTSGETIKPKSVFNIPEVDNSNFNPFATKSKLSMSPPLSRKSFSIGINNTEDSHSQIMPATKSDITVNNNSTFDVHMENIEENKTTESNTTASSKISDDKNDTVREVHTDNDDTIEGQFFEAENNDDKLSDFEGEKVDMVQFTEFPPQTNGPDAEEMFINADAFEFLMNQNQAAEVADSGKESLFLKFDPLFAKRVNSDGVVPALSNLQRRQSTPKRLANVPKMDITFEKPINDSSGIDFNSIANSTMKKDFDNLNVTGTMSLLEKSIASSSDIYDYNTIFKNTTQQNFEEMNFTVAKPIASSSGIDFHNLATDKAQENASITKPVFENPIASSSSIDFNNYNNDITQEFFDELNVTVSKPTMIVPPAVNPVPTPRTKMTTPVRSNRLSMTFTSPAMAVIDRLLSLSGNNSLLGHDTTATQTRQHSEADIALTQLRELLAEKEIQVHQLRVESKEMKDRLSTLESQMKRLENDNTDRLKKIGELNDKLNEKTQINRSMAEVVKKYEGTISQFIAEIEEDKIRNANEKIKLMKERDEQSAHLASMEVSFSDLHSKYEKSKQIILSYKANEDVFKKSINEFEANLVKMQNNYELLKQHATSKLNHANQELEKINRAHEAEVLKLNAMIKRKDLHITSLEETLAQKAKANEELTAICDELINKVGGQHN